MARSLHERTAIRRAAVTALSTIGAVEYQPAAGGDPVEIDFTGKVYDSPVAAFWGDDLPAIGVYTPNETNEDTDVISASGLRTCRLVVVALMAANAELHGLLDAAALAVESALHADTTLGGAALDMAYRESSLRETAEAERITGSVHLTYDVRYMEGS